MYSPRTRLGREILSELTERFKHHLLETRVRQTVYLKEAASYGLPIIKYDKNSLGSWDYRALAEEIIAMEDEVRAIDVQEHKEKVFKEVGHGAVPKETPKEVVFLVDAPQARSVYVVGEFNRWQIDPTGVLDKDEKGLWKKQMRLSPGTYQYKFYVDGEWVVDPYNPFQIVTESGVVNSLVKIK
jgi:hypothetical protein